MVKVGDKVEAPNCAFWLTVVDVNASVGIAYCNFGSTNNYAGGFPVATLQPYHAPSVGGHHGDYRS